MFKRGLVLPIFYDNAETFEKDKHDIKYPITECDIRKWTFYCINAIGVYVDLDDNNKIYGLIYYNNSSAISPMSRKELVDIVNKHLEECLK